MTALCGGGTSGPKPGYAETIILTTGELATVFEQSGNPWLVAAAALLGVFAYDAVSLCSSDPPTMPTFTAAEAQALLQANLSSADFTSAIAKLPNVLLNILWSQYCQCTNPPQPNPSPPVPIPPGVLIPAPGNYCADTGSFAQQFASNGSSPVREGGVSTSATTIRFFGSVALQSGTAFAVVLQPFFYKFSNNVVYGASQPLITLPTSGAFDFRIPTPAVAGWDSIGFNYFPPGGAGNIMQVTLDLASICAGPNGDCCPPDPNIALALSKLTDLLQSMQRSYGPFAYVLGSSSPGLTGTGSVPVSRAIGVKVQVTAYPATDQILPGNPSYIKDLGWISVSESDGMIQEYRIARAAFTWFPQLMPLADHINYFLQPGVTATITPILPEA